MFHHADIANRIIWNNTIGEQKDRVPHTSPWAEVDESAWGLHENLNLFESFPASPEPILGLYAGYSLGGQTVSEEDLAPFVKSAVDQVHYIKDAQGSSDLARLREKNGRAKPWNLNIVEVGNEDWLGSAPPSYKAYRFKAFSDALRKDFPDLTILSSSPYLNSADLATLNGIDQHDYNTPQFFFDHSLTLDGWARNDTKIWELEFAVLSSGECGATEDVYTSSCRLTQPILIGSLAEAAFMAGMERNGDVFSSAAYAPVFSNRGETQWSPDLISFDWNQVVLSTSYYVQQAYGLHPIDKIVATKAVSGTANPIYWSVGTTDNDKTLIIKLINRSTSAQTVTLTGLTTEGEASIWGIKGDDAHDANTFDSPDTVKPYTSKGELKEGGDISLPALSFEVWTLQL